MPNCDYKIDVFRQVYENKPGIDFHVKSKYVLGSYLSLTLADENVQDRSVEYGSVFLLKHFKRASKL